MLKNLPAPLSNQETIQLFNALPNKEIRDKLICCNIRLVVWISQRLVNEHVSQEDLISVGFIGLIKAVDTFNVEKGIKFATYANRCIENEMLMFLRNTKKYCKDISLQSSIYNTEDNYKEFTVEDILVDPKSNFIEKFEDIDLFERTVTYILNRFPIRDTLLMLYKIAGMKQREIAKILPPHPLSQSYISRLEKKMLKKLSKIPNFNIISAKFTDLNFSVKDDFYCLRVPKRIHFSELKALSLEVKQTSKFIEVKMPLREDCFLLIAEVMKMLH